MKASINKNRKKKPPLLNKEMQYRVAMFLQDYPPKAFNQELRNLFIDYLVNRHKVSHRIKSEMVVEAIWDLIRLLDRAADCWEHRDTDEIIEQYQSRQ